MSVLKHNKILYEKVCREFFNNYGTKSTVIIENKKIFMKQYYFTYLTCVN